MPFLGTDPASTVNLYGSTRQRTPLTHYVSPEGSHHLFGDRAAEHECWCTGNVGKQETRQRWKLENAAWKICSVAEKTWNKKEIRKQMEVRGERETAGWTLALPPATHSAVYEMSSKAISVHTSPPTSAWKVTLKGPGLDRITLVYVHWLPWFPVVAHISRLVPLGPTV